jgi:hypothetical protein
MGLSVAQDRAKLLVSNAGLGFHNRNLNSQGSVRPKDSNSSRRNSTSLGSNADRFMEKNV